MTDPIARLRRHREIGVEILFELMHATADTWEKAVERQLAWEEELIPLVEPFGPQAARFKPLTPMRLEEQLNAARVHPPNHDHYMALVRQDVSLYRLNELFAGFPPSTAFASARHVKTWAPEALEELHAKGELTFQHGELAAISREIAFKRGGEVETIRKVIQPRYHELKAALKRD